MNEQEIIREIKYWSFSFFQYAPLYFIAGLAFFCKTILSDKPVPRHKIMAAVFLGCLSTWAFMVLFRFCGWNPDVSAVFATGAGSAGSVGFYVLQSGSLAKVRALFSDKGGAK